MIKSIHGQNSKVLELGDAMFFNIFNHHPDSSIYDYIKKYFPSFTKEHHRGSWTTYPLTPIPEYQSTMHSFFFTKHPYFEAKFKEGRLDILSKENKDEGPGVTDFQLWFFFDNKKDAEFAFIKLSSMFEKISIYKRIYKKNSKKVANYSDTKEIDWVKTIEFVLTADELFKGKYKIFFRIGAFTYTDYN